MTTVTTDSELTPEQLREKITICIVDDFQTMCTIMRSTLTRVGFKSANITSIAGARAGPEMLKALESYKQYRPQLTWKIPRLLFIDWNMPEVTGFDLLRKIRECDDPRIRNMIVIMVSAESIRENVIAAIQAGIDNYITKPLTQKTVEKKMREISTGLIRKTERMIENSSGEISEIIDRIDLAIALDTINTKAQRVKSDFLSNHRNEVTRVADVKIKTGKESVDAGKYNMAVGDFTGALELKPTDQETLVEYGKMMMKKTLYEKAVESFQQVVTPMDRDPEKEQSRGKADMLDLLGEAQGRLGFSLESGDEMLENASETLERAYKLHKHNNNPKGQANSLRLIGIIHAGKAKLAEKKMESEKKEGGPVTNRSLEYYKHAIDEFKKSVKLDSKAAACLLNLSQAYARAGQGEEAKKLFHKVLEMKPEEPAALIELAMASLEKGDKKGAMTHFNAAKKLISPEDTELYEKIILALFDHNMPDEALPFLDTIGGERPDLFNNLGLCYRKTGQTEEAIKAYGRAIKFDITGNRVSYIYNRGMAYKISGNNALAIQNYLEAYKTDNTFNKAAQMLHNISDELCRKAQQDTKNSNEESAVLNFQLSLLANQNSQEAKKGLEERKINPSGIFTKETLIKMGVSNPSVILEDYGG